MQSTDLLQLKMDPRVQVLLKNGADPDKRDAEGKTALEQVAKRSLYVSKLCGLLFARFTILHTSG